MGERQGRLKCAWCGRDLGPSGTKEDSHGICKQCKRQVFDKGKQR